MGGYSYSGKIEDPLSLNRYTYCHNNPLFYFDPTCHNAWTDFWEEVGYSIYDLDVEFTDCWNTGYDSLSKNRNSSVRALGSWCGLYRDYTHNLSNDLYDLSKNAVKCGKSALTSLELDVNAGIGIGGKFNLLDDTADAELMLCPLKERWKFNSKGYKVDHTYSESIGISLFNCGIRGYMDDIYNEEQYQTKGAAYANSSGTSYGFEANIIGCDFEKDFGTNTTSIGQSFTFFDCEFYAIFGGGISLSIDIDEFFEKVKE